MTNQKLLEKVKENLSLDFDEQDDFLLSLIESVKNIASQRTGLDFEIDEMPNAVAQSIVTNVANKFDDNGAELDVSIFQMFNRQPMF